MAVPYTTQTGVGEARLAPAARREAMREIDESIPEPSFRSITSKWPRNGLRRRAVGRKAPPGCYEDGGTMNIALSPELEKLLAEKVERGEIQSADKLVELALTFYFDYEAGAIDEQEFRETQAAIDAAREQSRRGEALTARRVFEELRAKHGIPR